MRIVTSLSRSTSSLSSLPLRAAAATGRAGGILRDSNHPRWISSSRLVYELTQDTTRFDNCPPKEELQFGKYMSDHMLCIPWKNGAWQDPKIMPYGDLSISPAAVALHYGLQCFEGMKAYRGLQQGDDKLRLFRPHLNMARLKSSMERLHMPGTDFDADELLKCMQELIRIDRKWIPQGQGYSLYVRPLCLATNPSLGLNVPEELLLCVMTCPVGPYFPSGFRPIALTADTDYVRAWPGGTGNAKVGGNYGPTMKPAAEAAAQGYPQVLWLFGDDDVVTEVGSMNVFVVLRDAQTHRLQLITAPLTRGDILPGVTRQSILDLARSWPQDSLDEPLDVAERLLTMKEVVQASEEGRLEEVFGAGTACVVTPVNGIRYRGKDISIPATGKLTQRLWDEITAIQYGEMQAPEEGWSVTF